MAGDGQAEALYQAALEHDLANWPCYRGRMLLWYGRWLRRQRRAAESRTPLRSARDGFDALAFPALAEKARQELRAAGETSHRRMPESWDQLTPQELQIARLAASGLSNREIAEQLFISHRTVGYHLHQNLPQAPGHLPQPAPHSLARPGLAAARYGNCRAACHSQPRSSHHTADCHPRGLNRRRTYDLRALGTTIRQAWRPATHHPLRQSPPTWQAGLGTRGGRCALSEFSYSTRHLTP